MYKILLLTLGLCSLAYSADVELDLNDLIKSGLKTLQAKIKNFQAISNDLQGLDITSLKQLPLIAPEYKKIQNAFIDTGIEIANFANGLSILPKHIGKDAILFKVSSRILSPIQKEFMNIANGIKNIAKIPLGDDLEKFLQEFAKDSAVSTIDAFALWADLLTLAGNMNQIGQMSFISVSQLNDAVSKLNFNNAAIPETINALSTYMSEFGTAFVNAGQHFTDLEGELVAIPCQLSHSKSSFKCHLSGLDLIEAVAGPLEDVKKDFAKIITSANVLSSQLEKIIK